MECGWGKNFTERGWVEGSASIAESVAAENPGPFLRWFGQVLEENFAKIQRNLPGVAARDLERWVLQSLKSKQIIRYRASDRGGVCHLQPVADGRVRRTTDPLGIGWTYVPEFYTERVEKRIPLPSWHQFYIRYRLVPDGGTGGGIAWGGPGRIGSSTCRQLAPST